MHEKIASKIQQTVGTINKYSEWRVNTCQEESPVLTMWWLSSLCFSAVHRHRKPLVPVKPKWDAKWQLSCI